MIQKCETCGTTTIEFDPPLVFEPQETCGYTQTFLISVIDEHLSDGRDPKQIHKTINEKCVNKKDHDDNHWYLIEELIQI